MAALTYTPAPYATPTVRDGGRLVVQTWLITRLLMVGVALWVGLTTGRSASDMLANWDVQHYFDIAKHGYVADNDIAFFPGWPLVLRLVSSFGVPMLWAGVGLALICSALAAAALHRLGGPIAAVVWLLAPTTVFTMVPYTEAPFCAAAFWAWERAKAGRWGTAAGLAAVACTMRVSGLFLLGALVILALTQRLAPSGAGLSGPAAWSPAPAQPGSSSKRGGFGWPLRRQATTQPSASAVQPTASARSGVGWPWRRQPEAQQAPPQSGWPPPQVRRGPREWARDERARALAWLLVPALTLFTYVVYLYNLTGDWNAWYRAQSTGWPRGFTWPWVALQHTFEAATSTAYPAFPEWSWVFRAELASMIVGVIVTIVCLRKRRWAEASWVGIQVLAFSCSYWYLSVNRAVLLWFPLFVLIGERLSSGWNVTPGRRRRRMLLTTVAFAAACYVLCWWAWLFFTGRWAS